MTDYADLEKSLREEAEDCETYSQECVMLEAADAISALTKQVEASKAFTEFVLRHTLPARAKARTYEETHSIIAHHPFVTDQGRCLSTASDAENSGTNPSPSEASRETK